MKTKVKKYKCTPENKKFIKSKIISNKKKKRKFIYPIIIIFVILLFFFISFMFFVQKKVKKIYLKQEIETINYNVENILTGYNFNITIKEEIKPFIKYIEFSKKGMLLKKNGFISSQNPKISIVISVYNRENNITSAIRSIQNQNFEELEIIIIDDFSSDNSTLYVKAYQKEDPRIILLQNKQNMGTLYSKSIGVLYAKGKYIHSLDSDDMFCNPNYLSLSYSKAIEGNYDFISSTGLYINELNKSIKFRQPFWVVIWAKLIRKELYQDSIFKLGIDIFKMKVLTLDDDIIAPYLFFNKKSINLQVVGVSHFTHKSQHVYSNAFGNTQNAIKFCNNLMTTVKAFYLLNNAYAKTYGKFLADYFFKKGVCRHFYNKEEMESLTTNKTMI